MDLNGKLMQVTKTIEDQLDSVIERMDQMDVSELEALRKNRIKEMKEHEKMKIQWSTNGHGTYNELPEEKQFFDVIKKSENVILHLYTNGNERCKIVDMHLKQLAPKHEEALFTKLNAEKSPFITDRLNIRIIPTILCINQCLIVDKIFGFTTLGNRDDFSNADMEWRLAQNGVLKYEGDLSTPPSEREEKPEKSTRKIRSGKYNGDDDDDLYEEVEVDKVARYSLQKIWREEEEAERYQMTAEEAEELGVDL